MTAKERLTCIRNDLVEGKLSTAEIVDKYCECETSELRDSFISYLEALKHLYNLKKMLND